MAYNVYKQYKTKKGGNPMSEKEKDIIRKISFAMPKLDKEKQNYILGVAEGMVMAKEQSMRRKDEECDRKESMT